MRVVGRRIDRCIVADSDREGQTNSPSTQNETSSSQTHTYATNTKNASQPQTSPNQTTPAGTSVAHPLYSVTYPSVSGGPFARSCAPRARDRFFGRTARGDRGRRGRLIRERGGDGGGRRGGRGLRRGSCGRFGCWGGRFLGWRFRGS